MRVALDEAHYFYEATSDAVLLLSGLFAATNHQGQVYQVLRTVCSLTSVPSTGALLAKGSSVAFINLNAVDSLAP